MRHNLIVTTLLALLVAACGNDGGMSDAPTSSTPAPVVEAPPTGPEAEQSIRTRASPEELADRIWDSWASGDHSVWRSLMSDGSPVFDQSDWFWLRDFDGDGVVALADWLQFEVALAPASQREVEWTCGAVSGDAAQCSVSLADAFYKRAGVEMPGEELVMTFESDRLVEQVLVEPADPESYEQAVGEAKDGRYEELLRYEQWVNETYPDRHSQVFTEPCCGVEWITLPDAIPIHEELMPEYLAAAESPGPTPRPTEPIDELLPRLTGEPVID